MTTRQDRLVAFIEARYGSQAAFAREIGVGRSQVNDWCTGRRGPGDDAIVKFAKAGLNVHWWATGVGDMDAPKPTGMQPTDLSDLRSIDARVTAVETLEQLTALLLRDIEEQKKKQKPEEK